MPAEYRPRVWVVISKAEERRAARPPDYYESMARTLHTEELLHRKLTLPSGSSPRQCSDCLDARPSVECTVQVSLGLASSSYLSQIELVRCRLYLNVSCSALS